MKTGSIIKKIFLWGFGIFVVFVIIGILIGEQDKNNNAQQSIIETNDYQNRVEAEEVDGELFLVKRVIDGDTIELDNGDKVRYIGIETPEIVHPSKPVECFGQEASNVNKILVEGKEVKLEKDISETDKYGRLLRYVYVGDIFVNDYLVRNGYASAASYPPDVKYQNQFLEAEREARENLRGLWLSCEQSQSQDDQKSDTSPPVTSLPASESEPEFAPNPSHQPEPEPDISYICTFNTYNCSDFTTHAEAQSVYEYCGGVNNDVHQLDRDKDGLACETLP